MVWCGIEGHDAVVERFRRSLRRGRLASSFLFIGPAGIGKRTFALKLAQALLCERGNEADLDPCEQCPSCQQITADTHPDVDRVSRPEGRSEIPVALFIGDHEHRSREGLCHRISLRPSSGRRRIAIIDDADFLNKEGANCLLKTLEEPPPRSLLILIGTSLQRQLPTIRSRCQLVRFRPLPDAFVNRYVRQQGFCTTDDQAARLADLAEGSLDRARQFAAPELQQFAEQMAAEWSRPIPETLRIAKQLQSFVESAGREAPVRRNRLRQVIQMMIRHLQHEILACCQSPSGSRTISALGRRPPLDVAAARLDRSLLALEQIDANANLATLIECWVDDLEQTCWAGSEQARGLSRPVPGR
jgi:DNA polymerase-3 subunit delta'